MSAAASSMHHEQQEWMFCAIHSINTMLQHDKGSHVTKKEMDEICEWLAEQTTKAESKMSKPWFNPHRSWLHLGDYDANVLITALKRRSLSTSYHDSRMPIAENVHVVAEVLRGSSGASTLVGFIVNRKNAGIFKIFGGRHWFTLRFVSDEAGGAWFNFDSTHSAPVKIGEFNDALAFVQAEIDSGSSILVVTSA
jgi:hypothetical protein